MTGYFSAFTKKPSLSQASLRNLSALEEKVPVDLQFTPLKQSPFVPKPVHEVEGSQGAVDSSLFFQELHEFSPLPQNTQALTREGMVEFRTNTGILSQTSIYTNNVLNGETIIYTPQGQILQVLTYKENKLHGLCKFYDQNHQLVQEIIYKNGEFEGTTTLYKNGNVLAAIPYKAGLQDGEVIYFQENSLKRLTQFFVQGKKNGLCFIYDDYGRIIKVENYVDDLRDGECLTYDDQGNIIIQEFYEGGKRHGPSSLYNHEGNITKVTQYRHGIPYEEE